YRFFQPTASWLARRWGDRLAVDWRPFRERGRLEPLLALLALPAEAPGLDEIAFPVREWVARLKAPSETDAAFLVRRFDALRAAPPPRPAPPPPTATSPPPPAPRRSGSAPARRHPRAGARSTRPDGSSSRPGRSPARGRRSRRRRGVPPSPSAGSIRARVLGSWTSRAAPW